MLITRSAQEWRLEVSISNQPSVFRVQINEKIGRCNIAEFALLTDSSVSNGTYLLQIFFARRRDRILV